MIDPNTDVKFTNTDAQVAKCIGMLCDDQLQDLIYGDDRTFIGHDTQQAEHFGEIMDEYGEI